MTTTRPAPSLADVLRAAHDEWQNDDRHWAIDLHDHIAAAVAAHLASPEVIERMARASQSGVAGLAAWDDLSDLSKGMWREGIRAAVAAVVGE